MGPVAVCGEGRPVSVNFCNLLANQMEEFFNIDRVCAEPGVQRILVGDKRTLTVIEGTFAAEGRALLSPNAMEVRQAFITVQPSPSRNPFGIPEDKAKVRQ